MVISIIESYSILNKCLINVANDIIPLKVLEMDTREQFIRLPENPNIISSSSSTTRSLLAAFEINDWKRNFDIIELPEADKAPIDYLIYDPISRSEAYELIREMF